MVRGGERLSFLVVMLMAGVFFLAGCGDDDDDGPSGPGDITPPAAVTDLAAEAVRPTHVRLEWTAPGDDGMSGQASQYSVLYSTTAPSEDGWSGATRVEIPEVPKSAGEDEEFTVTGLQSGTLYYFGLKAADEVQNWSGESNVAMATTPSGQVPEGFFLIQPGAFTRGSPSAEPGRDSDEREDPVTLTRAFYLSDHEVTQAEWEAVMGWNDSHFSGDSHPVEMVTWYDCINFCNKKSQSEGLVRTYTLTNAVYSGEHITSATVTWNQNAEGYRLPTEAEWEYACRATSTTAFCNGGITHIECSPVDPNLTQVGWYCGNAEDQTHGVMGKIPNAWDLYDMHGNVWEWCWDWYGSYLGPEADPIGPASGSRRVERGGSWSYLGQDCRSACRSSREPGGGGSRTGFRLARTAP